jgi:hypothetical protein
MGAEVAMIELTQEQRQELKNPEPRARDPQTNETYVLVRSEVYARMKALLDDELPDAGALMNEVMAEDDANDPYLESYQHYAKEGP